MRKVLLFASLAILSFAGYGQWPCSEIERIRRHGRIHETEKGLWRLTPVGNGERIFYFDSLFSYKPDEQEGFEIRIIHYAGVLQPDYSRPDTWLKTVTLEKVDRYIKTYSKYWQ